MLILIWLILLEIEGGRRANYTVEIDVVDIIEIIFPFPGCCRLYRHFLDIQWICQAEVSIHSLASVPYYTLKPWCDLDPILFIYLFIYLFMYLINSKLKNRTILLFKHRLHMTSVITIYILINRKHHRFSHDVT